MSWILESPQILQHLDVYPINKGAFTRHFDLLSREDNLGDIPQKIACESRRILRDHCLPTIYAQIPWLEAKISLNQEEAE